MESSNLYNSQLEQLIDAALTDGELTEKEKQILFKKAQSFGVDLDEFEMVLDARLVKLKKATAEQNANNALEPKKLDEAKKCPSCGSIVKDSQSFCPECGCDVSENVANSSKKLSEIVNKILQEKTTYLENKSRAVEERKKIATQNMGQAVIISSLLNPNDGGNNTVRQMQNNYANIDTNQYPISPVSQPVGYQITDEDSVEQHFDKRIREAITNFPLPNTKADLLEFVLSLKAKKDNGAYASAYGNKYKECIEKIRIMFQGDKDFAPIIESYELEKAKDKKNTIKVLIGFGIFFAIIILVLFLTGQF